MRSPTAIASTQEGPLRREREPPQQGPEARLVLPAGRWPADGMDFQRLIVLGASGFLGRHLLDALKDDVRIFGLARRPQALCEAPVHPNISWHQIDIRNREGLRSVFAEIRERGPIDGIVHLAAHYDFSTENPRPYWEVNVDGLRNVLEEARKTQPGLFLFASSLAACEFPPPGEFVDESTPPHGRHVYAQTKGAGEAMVRENASELPCAIVRFAAMFSDWCEYPPLFVNFSHWLSSSWRRRILGGRGKFAIPYLHVTDAIRFIVRVLERRESLSPAEVLLATTRSAVSTEQLHRQATTLYSGDPMRPVPLPRSLCAAGIYAQQGLGRILGYPPFEQPWMARYIDRRLAVDPTKSYDCLDWQPRQRLEILRRLPFLIENLKTNPVEWNRRNHAAMTKVELAVNLEICRLIELHSEAIRQELIDAVQERVRGREFPGHERLSSERLGWLAQVALRHLINSIRTRDKTVYLSYCRDLATRSLELGIAAEEVCECQSMLGEICLQKLGSGPNGTELAHEVRRQVFMTFLFGRDQVFEVYEQAGQLESREKRSPPCAAEAALASGLDRPRSQALER